MFLFSFTAFAVFKNNVSVKAFADEPRGRAEVTISDEVEGISSNIPVTPHSCPHCGSSLSNALVSLGSRDSSTTTTHPTFSMQEYFENLSANMAKNEGTCGLVALCAIISYYDTFLNDNIMPNAYEVHSTNQNISPGVIRHTGDYTADTYITYSDQNWQSDLQALLFKIHDVDYPNPIILGLPVTYLTVIMEQYQTAINYDLNYTIESDSVFHDAPERQQAFLTFIKEKLTAGVPVIVGVKNDQDSFYFGGSNHYVIAYEYDEENDIIYTNYGWNSSLTRVPLYGEYLGTVYNQMYGVWSIDFELPHVHSFNYDLATGDYCGCGYFDHVHSVDTWTLRTPRLHSGTCTICNELVQEEHIYDYCVNCPFSICAICSYKIIH